MTVDPESRASAVRRLPPRAAAREPGPRAWVLNLDAEHELEAGRGYAPTRELARIVALQGRRLQGDLVRPGDVVVSAERLAREPRAAAGLPGFAWCPTPQALALLEQAGARPAAAPPAAVLRAVNARPFAAALRAELGAPAEESFAKHVAATLAEVLELVARPAEQGWLVRRTFGAAGRGRRRMTGRPAEPELAWLAASLRRGPLVVEPWVAVTLEYTRSAWVGADGAVVISPPCFQATEPSGAWTRTQRAGRGELARADDLRLEEAVERAGRALAAAGYFGPFGIDAFRHRAPGRAGDVLNPLSEINARYTMDWALAMGAGRAGAGPLGTG